MKTITEITKPVARAIGQTIELELAELGKKHGLTFKYSGGSFRPEMMTVKLEVGVLAATGGKSKHELDYEQLAPAFGMKTSWLGKTFTTQGKQFTLVGLRTRGKNNAVVRVKSGKEYVMHCADVIMAFGGKKKGGR